jgi:6-phosphogluconolactonase
MQLQVLPDAAAVAAAIADRLGAAAAPGAHLVLTGGSSPKAAYELLAERQADLSGATLWFGDDRAVGPESPDSNFRLAADALLDHLPEPQRPRVHRIEGELGAPVAADRYDALMRAELGDEPVFDLLLLGMGPDGHVASLFPGKPEMLRSDGRVVAVPEAGLEPFVPRVSMTLPVLMRARSLVLLITGEGKAQTVARAFGPQPDESLPAARLGEADQLLVLLDEAAASGLPGR